MLEIISCDLFYEPGNNTYEVQIKKKVHGKLTVEDAKDIPLMT